MTKEEYKEIQKRLSKALKKELSSDHTPANIFNDGIWAAKKIIKEMYENGVSLKGEEK